MAFSELAVGLGLKYLRLESLNGGQSLFDFDRIVTTTGCSHAKRLQASFKNQGTTAKWLETRNWRQVSNRVNELQDQMVKAVADKANPLLVIQVLDNVYRYFQTACLLNGTGTHFIPHRKDNTGHYHVDGDLLCCPAEATTKQFLQHVLVFPNKIVMMPLPATCVQHAVLMRNMHRILKKLLLILRDKTRDPEIVLSGLRIQGV
jgi:hypothetical protein